MSTHSRKYWAFISYSHRDEKWAVWLHRFLETYRLPKGLVGRQTQHGIVPRRLFPIFRDRDELPSASDLGAQIRLALENSSALIVVCSPHAATSRWVNEEIGSFQKLGRGQRIYCLLVDGEPGASRRPDGGQTECFPPAVLSPVDAIGRSDLRTEPLAVDVRPGGDGRENAALKLIAGILDLNFDDLRQRERLRKKRANAVRALVDVSAFLGAILGYTALADLGISLPGSNQIQTFLDRRDWSFFRVFPEDNIVQRHAKELSETLLDALSRARDVHGRFAQKQSLLDRWDISSHNQAWLAIARSEGALLDSLAGDFDLLRAVFLTDSRSSEPNFERDWLTPSVDVTPTDGIGLCWQLTTLAVFAQNRDRLTSDEREQLRKDVDLVQQALRPYTGAESGSWNIYPHQLASEESNAYSAVMVLLALLELKQADLAWEGSVEHRDRLLKDTAQWLVKSYRTDGKEPGWHGTGQDSDEMLDGLSLQCMAILLRAAVENETELPASMVQHITETLIDCVHRPFDFPVSSGEFEADINWHGQKRHLAEAIRFLWYPWALESMHAWLKYEERNPQAAENRVRIRRARAHLVVDIGPTFVDAVSRDWTFVSAETLYGLASVR